MKTRRIVGFALGWVAMLAFGALQADPQSVMITPELNSIQVQHQGKPVIIQRNQNPDNRVSDEYALTSRPCPPFCIRPIQIAPGVETIGELELLDYLQRAQSDPSIMIIDSRTPDWVAKGTIPGSVNLPWTELDPEHGANSLTISAILEERFNARLNNEIWDFAEVKTLVLFCNGMWCGQSPRNINTLLQLGYPAHKLKWYRGGMQDWSILGLTVIKP